MALPAVEKLSLPSKKSSADWSVGIKLSFVTDPHAAFGAWQGCEVVGGGMNYDAIVRSNGLRQKFVADTKLLSRNLTLAFNL